MIAERAADVKNLEKRFGVLSRDEAAAVIASVAHRLDCRPSGSGPAQQQDVGDMPRANVIAWLTGLNLPDARVRACWISRDEGIEMQLSDFLQHYDDLWFPGADDVVVAEVNGQFVLFFDHDERITLWCEAPAAATRGS